MTTKKQKSFLLYTDFELPFNFLSLEDRGLLITLIFQYVRLGDVDLSDSSELVKLAFSMIRTHLDRDREQYEEKCRINAENGRKGGRPRKVREPLGELCTEETETETETTQAQEDIENCFSEKDFSAEKTERLQTPAKKAYNNNNNENNNNNDNNNNNNNDIDIDNLGYGESHNRANARSAGAQERKKEKRYGGGYGGGYGYSYGGRGQNHNGCYEYSSFDTDDFFNAALKRSYENI